MNVLQQFRRGRIGILLFNQVKEMEDGLKERGLI